MMQPASPYRLNDLLLLIGQCTVELAFLRGRIQELERQLDEHAPSNGVVHQEEAAAYGD